VKLQNVESEASAELTVSVPLLVSSNESIQLVKSVPFLSAKSMYISLTDPIVPLLNLILPVPGSASEVVVLNV
jgi:hypothetical protein